MRKKQNNWQDREAIAKEQALKTAALNSFIRNAIGIRPAQEFVIEDEATAEELQEVREMKMRGGFQPQRRQQQRQDVIERAVLEEQQPILPATLPTPPPTVQSFTQTPPQGAPTRNSVSSSRPSSLTILCLG